jgi:predicted phage terminase large subunit-like protein
LNEKDVSAAALELGYDHLCIPMRWETDRKIADIDRLEGSAQERRRIHVSGALSGKQVVELETSLGSYAPPASFSSVRRRAQAACSNGAGLKSSMPLRPACIASEHGISPEQCRSRLRSGLDGRREDGPRSRRLFLHLDVERFRATPAKVETTITNTASQDRQALPDPHSARSRPGRKEPGAIALIRKLAGYIVKAVPPTGSKEARATPFSAQAEAGNIKVVKAPWNEAFFAELESFRSQSHDDQVDAAADAFNELAEGSSGFLELVQEENAEAAERVAEKAKAEAVPDADECPFPKGSVEWLRHHGLMK